MLKVSVIIPTYNHAQYLLEAVTSVQSQSYSNWEAIIVDDGSTDETAVLVAELTDSRIQTVYQKNQGLSSARNTGIRYASGELIALLDADDRWQPAFLERMVQVFEEDTTADAAYCGFHYMDVQGTLLPTAVSKVVPPEQFRAELLRGNWLCPSAVVVRASVYAAAGWFDTSLRACEDYDMWLRMAVKQRFVGIPERLLHYRRLGDNMSDDVDRMVEAMTTVLERQLGRFDSSIGNWSKTKQIAARNVTSLRVQGYLSQNRVTESATSLLWLLRHCPDFAESLDFWYSLACVHQLVGQRGDFFTWQPDRAAADVFRLLDELATYNVPFSRLQTLHAQAHFALAHLNYGKGAIGAARRHLLSSIRCEPNLAGKERWLRLAGRLVPGTNRLKALVSPQL